MNTARSIKFLTAVLVTAGFLAGRAGMTTPLEHHTEYLADYGANQTAEIAGEHARDAGVPHQHNTGRVADVAHRE